MTSRPKLHHIVEYCTPKWWQKQVSNWYREFIIGLLIHTSKNVKDAISAGEFLFNSNMKIFRTVGSGISQSIVHSLVMGILQFFSSDPQRRVVL